MIEKQDMAYKTHSDGKVQSDRESQKSAVKQSPGKHPD